MDSQLVASRISKKITDLHVRFHREHSIEQSEFEAQRDRLSRVRKMAVLHKQVMVEISETRRTFEMMRRIMAYRRADLDNGARVVLIVSDKIGGWIDIIVDGVNVGNINEVNPRDYTEDVIVIANTTFFEDAVTKKLVFGWLGNKRWLNLPTATAVLLGSTHSVINLAHAIDADLSGDYLTLFDRTVRKFIMDTEDYIRAPR